MSSVSFDRNAGVCDMVHHAASRYEWTSSTPDHGRPNRILASSTWASISHTWADVLSVEGSVIRFIDDTDGFCERHLILSDYFALRSMSLHRVSSLSFTCKRPYKTSYYSIGSDICNMRQHPNLVSHCSWYAQRIADFWTRKTLNNSLATSCISSGRLMSWILLKLRTHSRLLQVQDNVKGDNLMEELIQ